MSRVRVIDAEVDGQIVDVVVEDGRIVGIGADVANDESTTVIDAGGGALLPGLHDHHLHLLSMAARSSSLRLGPPGVGTPDDFDDAVRRADSRLPPGRWIRGVDHDDASAGPVDRWRLDQLAPGRKVRVQHRSGALWTLSSAALAELPSGPLPDGVETGDDDEPTGRVWRLDDWLRQCLGTEAPALSEVGRSLVERGITGVTDATPCADEGYFEVLARAVTDGTLPVAVTVMGAPELAGVPVPAPLLPGPVKVVIADHDLPTIDAVAEGITRAHEHERPVAIHCVTAVASAIALAAWDAAGVRRGDRMEHGSVLDAAATARLAELGIIVITQPVFVRDHGDRYLREVDEADVPHLYRCATLLDAGVEVGGSSDAPHGDADPWRAIAAAVERRTEAGKTLGGSERVSARRALDLYLTPPDDPGGRPRAVGPGATADLCLLDQPLEEALRSPESVGVRITMASGRVVHRLDDDSVTRDELG